MDHAETLSEALGHTCVAKNIYLRGIFLNQKNSTFTIDVTTYVKSHLLKLVIQSEC